MICALRTFSLIINFLVGQNLNYFQVTSLKSIPFLGEYVAIGVGISNSWMIVGQLALVLYLVYVVDAMITIWRRGDKRQALTVGGSILFFVLGANVQVVLVFWHVVDLPLTVSVFFLGIIAAMSFEMTLDVLHAAQMSDDLHKKNQWLDLAADSAGIGLWYWDLKNNTIWATETARALYGFTASEPLTFEKLLAKIHPDDQDGVVQSTKSCRQEGTDFRKDYRILKPDGRIRWLKVLAKALFLPTGEPERMTGVSIDITNWKQMAQELQQKRDELSHLLRAKTLSVLSISLAHELKRPLGTILRNTEAAEKFLRAPSPDLQEVFEILEDIRKDDQQAGELIDRMRLQLKQHDTDHKLFDLHLLADEVLKLVKQEADSRNVRLDLELVSAHLPVYGDWIQLQQVLLNLLLNAMDALDQSMSEDRRIIVSVQNADSQAEIKISDTGPGIPTDMLARVFESFYTTKAEGLGMGLAISRDIIEAHGGHLNARNNERAGATFTIILPLAQEMDNAQ
jgi:PAS domain S-box-containing protein